MALTKLGLDCTTMIKKYRSHCIELRTKYESVHLLQNSLKPKEAPVDDFLQTCQSFSVGRENEPPDVHRGPLVVRLLHDQDVERLAELSAAVLINKKQGAGVRLRFFENDHLSPK